MYQNNACTINGKHTYRDWGLYVVNAAAISPPELKTQYIEVPGRDGDIDLTDALAGHPVYKNRTITLQLGGKRAPGTWERFLSDFMAELHGQKVEVIFDRDPDWYFVGRATVGSDLSIGQEIGQFTLTINAEPYKYSRADSLPEITVDGSATVRVQGSAMQVVPEIICSDAMTLTIGRNSYDLKAGSNKNYDIVLKNNVYNFTFTGNGTVQIKYRRGKL